MVVLTGDLWGEIGRADLILVSTNATLNSQGELVMGRGAALEAKRSLPGLAKSFGDFLKENDLVGRQYGLIFQTINAPPKFPPFILGAFQVKYHWKDQANLYLIGCSTRHLLQIAKAHPEKKIAMNMPGIGNGRLTEGEVLPIISVLPDNVYVYRR